MASISICSQPATWLAPELRFLAYVLPKDTWCPSVRLRKESPKQDERARYTAFVSFVKVAEESSCIPIKRTSGMKKSTSKMRSPPMIYSGRLKFKNI
jgi:hypothetical protein